MPLTRVNFASHSWAFGPPVNLEKCGDGALAGAGTGWKAFATKKQPGAAVPSKNAPQQKTENRKQKTFQNSAGFTLLELMVALFLTGLLTLVVFTSLNLSLKAWGRGQREAECQQQLRVGRTILERSLSSATAESRTPTKGRDFFEGRPQELRCFTPVPLEAHQQGGLYHFRALWGPDETGRGCLMVEQAKMVNWSQDPHGVEVRQILLRQVDSLCFRYGRGAEEFETWEAIRRNRLPDWVKVELTLAGRPQVWLIPIHGAGK